MISESRFNELTQKFPSLNPILVVGDIGIDKYTKGEVKRISPEAPVPIVEVFDEWNKLGLAANVTDNLRSLDVKSTICGVIGNDVHADVFENLLEENGLSTWGIIRSDDRPTTFKERVVTNTQQVCRVDYESKKMITTDLLSRLKTRVEEFEGVHHSIIIEDYGKGLFSEELCQYLIRRAKEKGQLIAVDPSRTTPPLWYKGANILKPNKLESQLMAQSLGYQGEDINEVAELLIDKLDLDKVIITLGAEGMLVSSKDSSENKVIPTFAREVFDVSGAGDTAISTLMAALAADATIEEAVWLANLASGVVVGKKGTALVTPHELKQFYEYTKSQLQ